MTIITYQDSASMVIYSARKRKMFAPVLEKITVNNFCIFFPRTGQWIAQPIWENSNVSEETTCIREMDGGRELF